MRPTVLLFDIDGTLISTGGAGRRAFERAVARRTGRPEACAFSFAGMTDRAIARAALTNAGHDPTEPAIDTLVEEYVANLADEIRDAACQIHRGIVAALDAAARAGASARAGCAIGLGTGNVRAGAQLKLGRVGLFERFAFGGFGSDHERRDELLRIGAARGAAALGAAVEACRVVVIGDTPKDVAAARAIGAESLAVATGQHGVEELAASGATWTFADLAAEGAIEVMLEGSAR